MTTVVEKMNPALHSLFHKLIETYNINNDQLERINKAVLLSCVHDTCAYYSMMYYMITCAEKTKKAYKRLTPSIEYDVYFKYL